MDDKDDKVDNEEIQGTMRCDAMRWVEARSSKAGKGWRDEKLGA